MAGFYKAPYQAPSLATGMAAPQKTNNPVQGFGAKPPAPAFDPRNMKGVDFSTLAKTAPIGQDLYNPLFATKSFTGIGDGYNPENNRWFEPETQGPGDAGWLQGAAKPTAGTWATEMGNNESGNPNLVGTPNQGAIDAFKDYRFDWTQGDRNAGTLTGYDPSGNKIGSWDQAPEPSTISQMGQALALAAAGFGGVGLMGLGPLGGVLGGAGGGAAAGSEAAIGNGAFLGEGVASGIPAWDAAAGLGFAETGAATGLSLEAAGLPGAEGFGFQNVAAATPEVAAGNGAFLGEGIASGVPQWDIAAGLGSGVEAAPFIPGADSAATGIASTATAPSTVNLGQFANPAFQGGTMGTAGGIKGAIAAALADPARALQSAGSSVLDFAKANPGLAASAVGGLASLTGSKPEMPSLGGTPGAGTLTPGAQGVANSLGALDFSGIPALQTSAGDRNTFNQEAIDAAYGMQTRYLDPQIRQQQQALEARLAEQGFVPGTPAYNQAMQNFMDTNQRAYAQARDSSILQGAQIGQGDYRNAISGATLNNSAAAQALEQYLAKRNQPINERNALLGGDQIVYNQQLDKYNAKVAESNNRNQSLSQLALALGMYLG